MPNLTFQWADLPKGPNDRSIANPKPDQLDEILDILSLGNVGFAILSCGDEEYIQTSAGTGKPGVPVAIEYRAGSADAHFVLDETDRGSQRMKQLFRAYLANPKTISQQGRWSPLKL